MTHLSILEYFRSMFPLFCKQVKIWFPNGKNSIRVRDNAGFDYVFAYNDKYDWRLETIKSFKKE